MRYTSVAFWIGCLAVLLSTTSCSKSRDERPWGEYAESSLVFQPCYLSCLLVHRASRWMSGGYA